MRLVLVTVMFAAMLAAAGCAPPPSARVPEVVTARPVDAVPATYSPPEATAAPAADEPGTSESPDDGASEAEPEREVVAPHVDEREDEEDEDAAPEEAKPEDTAPKEEDDE